MLGVVTDDRLEGGAAQRLLAALCWAEARSALAARGPCAEWPMTQPTSAFVSGASTACFGRTARGGRCAAVSAGRRRLLLEGASHLCALGPVARGAASALRAGLCRRAASVAPASATTRVAFWAR